MSDVKARLAAGGWSDRTRGGFEIVEWLPDGVGGFVGIVRDGHLLGCMEWSDTGGNTDVEDGESVWDLVPLPAPVAALQCPPVQKLATSGPSITRPVPAVDAWVTYGPQSHWVKWPVKGWETIDGETRIDTGASSIEWHETLLTGPSDRGPWRPIGEVK